MQAQTLTDKFRDRRIATAFVVACLVLPASAGDGWFEGFEAPVHTLGAPPANGWARMDACPLTPTPVVGNFSGTVHTGVSAMRIGPNDDVVHTLNITNGMVSVSAYVWLSSGHRVQLSLLNAFTPGICNGTPPAFTEAATFELDAGSAGTWFLGGQGLLNGLQGSIGESGRWVKIAMCGDLTNDVITVSYDNQVIATGAWTDFGEPTALAAVRITYLPAFGASVSLWDSISVEHYDAYPKPEVYCTPKLNSGCCLPRIGSFGLPKHQASASEPFWITCDYMVNQKSGMFFFGVTGPLGLPFRGGTLCVRAPTMRAPTGETGGNPPGGLSDCSGSLSIDFNAFAAAYTPLNLLQMESTQVWGQFYARDSDTLPCFDPNLTQLSDAITFVLN